MLFTKKLLGQLLLFLISIHIQTIAITIYSDTHRKLHAGFNNCIISTSGELNVIKKLIKPNSVVFDVGACIGEWSQAVNRYIPSTQIYAFEPVPDMFNQLGKNIANVIDIKIFNKAITNQTGTLPFVYYKNMNQTRSAGSSFFRRDAVEKNKNIELNYIDVEADTLDNFCSKHAIDHIDFLKIDTEGSEVNILYGAKNLLQNNSIDMVQFEYGGTYPDANTTLQEAYNYLTSYGYHIFRIVSDGIVHIAEWDQRIENYQYSNYLAITTNAYNRIK